MERLDRKFHISATHVTRGAHYTDKEAVLFLAKDNLFLPLLYFYLLLCVLLVPLFQVKWLQVKGVWLLIGRVRNYRNQNQKILKYPDIYEGNESKAVLRPNDGPL